jgi:ribonucleotide reductase beta subunit family protein with ferritin-like domain
MSDETEIHGLEPEHFLEEVHSFDFWFHSVQGYLEGTTFGHHPDLPRPHLSETERERLITVLCNYCVGETAALEGSSGLIAIAPNRMSKIFLATQVVDEGRHVEVFLHRLSELGVANPEAEIEHRANRKLLEFKNRLLDLVANRDWAAAIFAQNVILEAMEFVVFEAHAQNADPVTRELLLGIVKDERRHIGFGENSLGRLLQVAPDLRTRLWTVKRDLDHLVLATFRDMVIDIGLPRAGDIELGRAYLNATKRLGLV